jgi:hypothetical protein
VKPSKRRSVDAPVALLPLNRMSWIFAVAALAAAAIVSAHPPSSTLVGNHDVPVWITANDVTAPGANDVPLGPIVLGQTSAALKSLAIRIADAAYPCAAFALMTLSPADARKASERRDKLAGLPTAATVALVANGADSDAVSQSLMWIWDGPYVATGQLHVEINTTTVRANDGIYVSSVSSRIVDLNGFPLPDAPSLEPPFRFLWSAPDGQLLGVFRSE